MQNLAKENISETPSASTDSTYRITIMLSEEAAVNLERLKEKNESSSFGEIVRRSIQTLYRVYPRIGMPRLPESSDAAPMTRRVQAIVSSPTAMRIEKLCEWERDNQLLKNGKENLDLSKSEIVRVALELYSSVSEAQRDMREFVVEGRKGKINSSLALSP